jgi:hypothetical protein
MGHTNIAIWARLFSTVTLVFLLSSQTACESHRAKRKMLSSTDNESGIEDASKVFRTVHKVASPKRYLVVNNSPILIIGHLTNDDVSELLRLSGKQRHAADRVTSRKQYAIVQFGDLKRIDCCMIEILFRRGERSWEQIDQLMTSH